MSNQSKDTLNQSFTTADKMKFFIISFLGIIMFFTPLNIGGYDGVGIAVISDFTKDLLKPWKLQIILGILVISLVMTLIVKIIKPAWLLKVPGIKENFDVKPLDFVLRIVAVIIAVMTIFQVGPEMIRGESTGVEMTGLLFTIIVLFLFSSYLLVCLLDFGLMDFVGVLCTKFMRKLFTLPGRAALDTLASWVGSGSLGVVITSEAYEKGGYTRREAAIVMTMFSVTSISYAIFMADYVGLSDKFLQFYFTCLLCGIVCAILIPRIPPISKFEDTYYEGKQTSFDERKPENMSMMHWAYSKGVEKASKTQGLGYYLKKGTVGLLNYWFSLMPIVLTVGTVGLILVNYTPIFDYIAYPFKLLLELFGIPEATAAAPAMIVGFIDFFIPLPIAGQIESLMTRFVIVCMALVQVIYLTQVGALIMKSKVNINLWQLFVIFLERTIISLPIICGIAHLLF